MTFELFGMLIHANRISPARMRGFDIFMFGLPGRFETANAEEKLPFADNTFDHVYSFGVIHHSPAPERIASEIHRVLKKGGTFTVMLYNRSSINYTRRSCSCGDYSD